MHTERPVLNMCTARGFITEKLQEKTWKSSEIKYHIDLSTRWRCCISLDMTYKQDVEVYGGWIIACNQSLTGSLHFLLIFFFNHFGCSKLSFSRLGGNMYEFVFFEPNYSIFNITYCQ